jgi:SAM-dependent methyltransferase
MSDERAARARSFGSVAEDYDRYRPGPAPAVLDWLLPDGARAVVDMGAGTGALTRLLVDRVPSVIAVEPDPEMRRVLERRVPGATVLEGSAEALPVADGWADAVLGASMWHWVDPPRAFAQAARVLRSGGVLGVLWSTVDRTVPWADELWALLHEEPVRHADVQRTRRALIIPADAPFGPANEPHEVRYATRLALDDLVGLAGTYSQNIVIGAQEREARQAAVRARLAADERFADPAGVDVPMLSWCWRTVRD